MKIRFTTEHLSLVALAAIVLSSPAAFDEDYHDPDPTWLRAALKEPFKSAQVSGQASGYDVSLDRAQLQPYRDGAQQVLSLMQLTRSGIMLFSPN